MTVITASSIPNMSAITGAVQDPNSDLLYIASSSGYIFTWNETTQSVVSSFKVGSPLSSIDISADGKTLAVGEYSGNLNEYAGSPTTSVGLLTLSSHSLQTLTLAQTSTEEGGVVGVGWDVNGNLLVATDGQWIPYHFIPAGAQSFGSAIVPGSSPLSSASFIETTPDHRYVLALEGNITGAWLELYDAQAGQIAAQTAGYQLGTDGFNVGTGDINDYVGLIADIVNGSVLVLNFSLQHATGPATSDDIIGAHFNASGSTLYLWDATSQSILSYDTTTWQETGSIPVSVIAEQPSGGPLQPSGRMSLSEDGRYLTLLTGSGFDTIDLSNPTAVTQAGDGMGDTLYGTKGTDIFIVERGTNNFVGVGGKDTVVLDFPYADYTVTRQSDNSLVIGSTMAGEGPDHLTNIQTLQFSDVTAQVTATGGLAIVSPISDAAGILAAKGSDFAGLEISDSEANVQAAIDSLQTMVANGSVSSIALTDTGTPGIAMTPAQLATDGAALRAITTDFILTVPLTSASTTVAGLGDEGRGTVVLVPGQVSQYSLSGDGSGGIILTGNGATDHISGATQLKYLDAVEIIAQTPGSGSTITSGNVTELYAAVFGRQPDVPGLSFYTAQLATIPNLSLTTLASYFLASPEYTGNPAHAYAPTNAGDSQFISDCYENLLHRSPASGDVTWYLGNVINPMLYGLTPGSAAYLSAEAAAHAQVITYFSQSAEFLGDVQITAQHPADAQHWLVLI